MYSFIETKQKKLRSVQTTISELRTFEDSRVCCVFVPQIFLKLKAFTYCSAICGAKWTLTGYSQSWTLLRTVHFVLVCCLLLFLYMMSVEKIPRKTNGVLCVYIYIKKKLYIFFLFYFFLDGFFFCFLQKKKKKETKLCFCIAFQVYVYDSLKILI